MLLGQIAIHGILGIGIKIGGIQTRLTLTTLSLTVTITIFIITIKADVHIITIAVAINKLKCADVTFH